MNEIHFTTGDLIQVTVLLATIIASYWRLASRLALVEDRQKTMERRMKEDEGKLEKKLDEMSHKIDDLMLIVVELKTKDKFK